MTKDSKKKKMGCLAKTLIWLVIIVVVLGVFVQFWLDNTIQWSVNKLGPKVLGVDTSVQRVYLSPIQGRVTLEGLHVGNPEGFHTDGMFDLAKVDVDLSMRSLFSDPIVVSHVVVDGMEVTYEQGLMHSNVGTLIDNLSGEKKPDEEEKPEEPEEEKGEGRKLIIEKFSLANSKVRVAMTGMMGLGVPIPLPSMELEGIGAKSGGATGKDVALELLKDIGGLVTGTVAGVGGAVVDGAKAVGGAVADGAGAAVDAVSDSTKAIAGVFGFGGDDEEEEAAAAPEEVAEEATEVAEEAVEEAAEAVDEVAEPSEEPAEVSDEVNAVADAVSDSAKAVSDAISDGAKTVNGALAGMLGFGGEKEEAVAPEEPAEKSAEAVEETVEEAAEAVEEAVEPSEKPAEVSDEVNAVADAVSDSAKAVGDAISDGASAVGDAVSDGAKAVSGALKGMLGFGSDKAEEPAEPAAE